MTLEEKLEHFYKVTTEEATRQSEEIVEEYKNSLEKIFIEHILEEEKKAKEYVESERKNLNLEKNRIKSQLLLENKRKLQEKSKELADSLFNDVELKIKEFMKTDKYVDVLEKQIIKVKEFAKDRDVIIYLNISDSKYKDILEEKQNVKLEISDRDFLGGIRAVIKSQHILIDNSFLTKLDEIKSEFVL